MAGAGRTVRYSERWWTVQLHEKFIGLVIVCHGVNTIKLSQVKISTSEVIILGSENSSHTFFFTLFNEFITGCIPQVVGTQVWDATYCNQPITTLNAKL